MVNEIQTKFGIHYFDGLTPNICLEFIYETGQMELENLNCGVL